MTTKVEWVTTLCGCGCGVTFRQLRDPGREREYLNNAHKQRAYRARNPHKNHSGTRRETPSARRRREQEEAWAREESRKERDRERKAQARGSSEEQIPTPEWTMPHAGDDRVKAQKRRVCRDLMKRANHDRADPTEAARCRETADRWRVKYGL